ncbi:hypothetical protein MtrunA17_Chr8g0382511 [Medicago truncatula]|uniref:Uncharacterized protein n=1 Tax=Medicago truncatula TaxID=3880 RepID=A0A396GWF4_MEDTR|nr:hypothetical protein MtrunA17_Chr8g0382511 [Medicago truncatula]
MYLFGCSQPYCEHINLYYIKGHDLINEFVERSSFCLCSCYVVIGMLWIQPTRKQDLVFLAHVMLSILSSLICTLVCCF